jgi:hypothetical protein
MINLNKLKNKFSLENLSRQIGTKRKNFGIPVVVLDLKTKQSYEYRSIAEAARYFKTHPKTIWRIVYNKRLYLNRYQISEKNNKNNKFLVSYINYFYYFINVIKINKNLLYRVLLFIFLSILICIFLVFIFIIFKDIYDKYVFTLREGEINFNKYVSEHRYYLYHVLNNNNTDIITYKTNFINIKGWRFEYVINNKWTSIHNNKLSIYQSIINAINLDFNARGNLTFSRINSAYSSPLIERVNINSIFSNAIASTNITNEVTNSLGIQGINYNRNSIIFGDLVINTKVKTTELLNYQSNILYCLINGLSPSIY